MKAVLQSQLERCEDEEERQSLERRIRGCDVEIVNSKQVHCVYILETIAIAIGVKIACNLFM